MKWINCRSVFRPSILKEIQRCLEPRNAVEGADAEWMQAIRDSQKIIQEQMDIAENAIKRAIELHKSVNIFTTMMQAKAKWPSSPNKE